MPAVDKSTKLYSTFDPRYIANCSLWLDAADRSSNSMTLSGSDVTVWKDKSASGNNATAAGAAPIISTYQNNLAISFGPASSYFTLTPSLLPNGTSSFTTFCVSSPIIYAGGNYMILNWGTASNPNAFRFWVSNTSGMRQDYFTGSSTNVDNVNVLNSTSIFSNTSTTSQTQSYRNGNSFFAGSSTVSYNIGTTFARIGADNSASQQLTGYVHEIVIYSRLLSDTERKQVEGYLAWKWGLQASLVSGHPYIQSVKHGPVLSTFNPATSLSGCVCWVDASDRRYFTLSGSNVNVLSDKSGGTTSITRYGTVPWSSTGLDGVRPAFNTNAGSFVATLTSALTNFTNTVFIVTKLTTAPIAGTTAVGFSSTSTGNGSTWYRCLDYTSSSFRSGGFFGTVYLASGAGTVVGSPFLFSSSYNGSSTFNNYLKAGTTSATNSSGSSTGINPAYCMIGSDSYSFTSGTTPLFWLNGLISEVIVFNRVLNDFERFMVDSYLSFKWGLQGDMPSGHTLKKYYPLTIN